jgi:hypothetical protein
LRAIFETLGAIVTEAYEAGEIIAEVRDEELEEIREAWAMADAMGLTGQRAIAWALDWLVSRHGGTYDDWRPRLEEVAT